MKKRKTRLPREYLELKSDLGEKLRDARRQAGRAGWTQARLAAEIGIRRETLSRIESGETSPSCETVCKIIGVRELLLEWDDLANRGGPSGRSLRHFEETNLMDLGENLRAGRRKSGLSLRALADATGICTSQLSLAERGQLRHSKLHELFREEAGQESYRFKHALLNELSHAG